jgi:DNA polymerase I
MPKVLIKADLAQAEHRVLVWKARIRRFIDRWLEDPSWSFHRWNASTNIWKKPIDQLTDEEYSKAKNGTYGGNYGIGYLKVARMYDMEYPEARLILERYHSATPEVKEVYQKELREELQKTRTLRNPFGRERIFFGRMDEALYRSAYSHYCQSTVADLILRAIIDLDKLGAELLLQVHDEVVLQCPEEELGGWCDRVREALSRPISFPGVPEPLVIPTEIKVGRNWHEVVSVEKWFEKEKSNA